VSLLDQFQLPGRTALVTWAASGIGAAIAVALAEAGADVICHGNTRPAERTAEAIAQLGIVDQLESQGGRIVKKPGVMVLLELLA
jgi:NAD(P)-dependent dehydrogenase (short-subunit alcohol dehydrogenase family)